MSLERPECELTKIEARLGVTAIPQVRQRPQHTGGADVQILERAGRAPAVPGLRAPEQLRPAQRGFRVGDDLADAGTDLLRTPALAGETLEVAGRVEHACYATSRTR